MLRGRGPHPRVARARNPLAPPERSPHVTTDLAALGRDLELALARRHTRARRRRKLGTTGFGAVVASVAAAASVAGTFGDGFSLDPTEWSILGGGSVDGGRGAYVHAQR